MNGTTDNEIINRILQGEHQLYAVLVERYQNFVFTIALKYVPLREDAEEIGQDVFVKAYKALGNFRGESKFSTWLYSIVNSTSLTFLRKKKPELYSLEDEQVSVMVHKEVSSAEQKSKREILNKSIEWLSPDDARIITLYYTAEQSLEEIATILNIEANTAKVKLHRARGRLKEKMEKHFGPHLQKELL